MHHSVVGGDGDVIRPDAALQVLHSAYPPYAQSCMIDSFGGRDFLCRSGKDRAPAG